MMKHTLLNRFAGAVLAIAFPLAALADVTGSPTLTANTSLNLETGATAASGGDLLWSGSSLTPQGSSKAFLFPGGSAAIYASLTQSVLSSFSALASASAIPSSQLTTGAVVVVFDSAGHSAKLLVTSNSGGSLGLQFTTFGATGGGGGGGTGGPSITKIQNNSSNVPQGFPNYGVAPSSLFIVGGSGLSDPADAVLQNTQVGLPLTLNGASITVVVNGVTTHPALYYAIPSQLAAVLPANTPVGDGTLTVSYKGANSNAFAIHVVSAAIGINNYNGGLAVAQDPTSPTGAIFTFTNSAAAGSVVTLWSTGLGADPADSDTTLTSSPHSVNTPLQIYIGGVTAADIRYQGSAGYPGVNIINVAVPQGAPLGCHVPVAIVAGGLVSNTVTLAIAASKGATCSDPQLGITGDQLSNLTGQGTVKTGSVAVFQLTSPGVGGSPTVSALASASFQQITGASFSSNGSVSIGGCFLSQTVTGSIPTVTGLDAGTITMTGPSGGPITLTTVPSVAGTYFAQLAGGAIPANGGSFAFHGSGGSQVGQFNATVNFPNPLLTWNNQSVAATVARSQGLGVSWSGGAAGSYVLITGTSASSGVSGSYTCIAPQSALQFTVPSYVLLGLPAGTGTTSVENASVPTAFSASGIDSGYALGAVLYSVSSTYN